MGQVSQALKVRNTASGVSNALYIEHLGLLIHQTGKLFPGFLLGPLDSDTEPGEEGFEQAVSASIEVDGSHDIVAGPSKTDDGVEDGSLS